MRSRRPYFHCWMADRTQVAAAQLLSGFLTLQLQFPRPKRLLRPAKARTRASTAVFQKRPGPGRRRCAVVAIEGRCWPARAPCRPAPTDLREIARSRQQRQALFAAVLRSGKDLRRRRSPPPRREKSWAPLQERPSSLLRRRRETCAKRPARRRDGLAAGAQAGARGWLRSFLRPQRDSQALGTGPTKRRRRLGLGAPAWPAVRLVADGRTKPSALGRARSRAQTAHGLVALRRGAAWEAEGSVSSSRYPGLNSRPGGLLV